MRLPSSIRWLFLGLAACLCRLAISADANAITWRDIAGQNADWYQTPEARRIADNVLYFQSDLGGWYKNDASLHPSGHAAIDIRGEEQRRKHKNSLDQLKYPCTLDNDSTWSELRFLAAVHAATGEQKYKGGFLKGVSYLLEAQYPNGGWPQFYPLRPGYSSRITFNDGAMIGAISLLDDVVHRRPPYDLADDGLREKCRAAVGKGRECILRCQIVVRGRKTAWCQQHDQRTLTPAQGRISENPSISGAESVGVVRYLMSIDKPSPEVVAAIEGAVAWFEAVKLTGVRVVTYEEESLPGGRDRKVVSDPDAPPIWARYYEIGTNRPMFIEKGVVKYKLAELSHAKRIGHLWVGGRWPERLLKVELPAWRKKHALKFQRPELTREADVEPAFFVADGLDADGSLVKFYNRGLDYAIKYFGNYGPYHVYLLCPDNEKSVRAIYRKRAENRANPDAKESVEEQVGEFLERSNIREEIDAVLAGKSTGGLTWSGPGTRRVYEDVTTNATGREKDPIENTWGALHEYHHVFQVAQVDSYAERTSERNFSSWMAEGGATYSSAKFMENLGLIDSLADYMLSLRTAGGNIGRAGINEFLAGGTKFRLDDESYWDKEDGNSAQVYYMLGAWATAYLIHGLGIDEKTVLKDWCFDILPLGKSAAFKKHMGISLDEFYKKFDAFIRQPDAGVMAIFAGSR